MGSVLEDRERDDLIDRLNARIAALEATVARLTAPVRDDEVPGYDVAASVLPIVLTAFLDRRMKG